MSTINTSPRWRHNPEGHLSHCPIYGVHFYRAGLRVGSIAGLGLNDVLDSGGNLKEVVELRREIVKNRKNYAVYLVHPELREALLDFLEARPEAEVDEFIRQVRNRLHLRQCARSQNVEAFPRRWLRWRVQSFYEPLIRYHLYKCRRRYRFFADFDESRQHSINERVCIHERRNLNKVCVFCLVNRALIGKMPPMPAHSCRFVEVPHQPRRGWKYQPAATAASWTMPPSPLRTRHSESASSPLSDCQH